MSKKHEPRHAPRLGASYRAGTKAVEVLSPALDEAANAEQARNFKTFVGNLKTKAWTPAYAGNLIVATADAALDTKMQHSGALSRGSVTAWVPEIVRLGQTMAGGGVSIGGTGPVNYRGAQGAFVESGTGFNSQSGTFNLASPNFWRYQGAKRAGQIIRKVARSGVGQRVFGPVKQFGRALGVTL